MTKTQKLFNALSNGRELSAAQIGRFGIANPTAAVSYLKSKGFDVVATQYVKRGVKSTKYKFATV